MTNTRTMPRWSSRVEESTRECGPLTVLLRVDRAKREAAELVRAEFGRARCVYNSRLVTAKKVSNARNTGGSIGEVVALMHANPASAQRIAAFVTRHADSVSGQRALDHRAAFLAEQEADAADDIVQLQAMTDRPSAEHLRACIARWDVVIATTRDAQIAAMKLLEEVE